MLDRIHISAFPNAQSTKPTTVTLRQFLTSTRHRDQIIALRAHTDKKERDALKKHLPAATISGTFTKRAAGNIETYNGLVCLDFDAADNTDASPAKMKHILAGFDEVAYAATSVGGAGVFAIIPTNNTDPTAHAAVVDLLGDVIHTATGLTYDRACKDVSRLRFISYDPEAYINPNPAIFDAVRLIVLKNEQENNRPPRPLVIRKTPKNDGVAGKQDRTRERVEALVAAVEQSRKDLTAHYDDWIKLGFAIAAHFGMDGEDYYQRLSQFHEKYDHQETSKKYADFVRNGRKIKIGTFFRILENNGFSL